MKEVNKAKRVMDQTSDTPAGTTRARQLLLNEMDENECGEVGRCVLLAIEQSWRRLDNKFQDGWARGTLIDIDRLHAGKLPWAKQPVIRDLDLLLNVGLRS